MNLQGLGVLVAPTRLLTAGQGRETMIVDGVTVLVLAILVLLLMWAVVLAGSQFFGPR